MITVYVDQSGKIEDTARPTVLAFSNGKKLTVVLPASDKRILQEIFRSKFKKQRQYVYLTFSALLVILLGKIASPAEIIIDREYTGKEALINVFCLELWKKKRTAQHNIKFGHVGKTSKAHNVAYKTFKGRIKADFKVNFMEILDLVIDFKNKK